MKRGLVLAVLLVGAVAAPQFYGPKSIQDPGSGQRAMKAPPSSIGVDQKLNNSIPLGLKFKDEIGAEVELRKYFTDQPVILMPVFYTCAGVCTLELNNMVDALRDFKNDNAGEDFQVVVFTIKPTEGPELAAAKKSVVLDIYNRRGAEDGWHFLSGEQESITALTDAIGFRYEYDASDDSVVHPAAAVILTPQGQISKYFLETDYPQQLLLDAVKDASKGRVGIKVEDTSVWNCVQIDPITGQRTLNIMKALNIAAVLTLAALVFSVVYMSVKYKVKGGTS